MKAFSIFTFLMVSSGVSAFASSSLPMACGPIQLKLNEKNGTISAPLQNYGGRIHTGDCVRFENSKGHPQDFTCTIYPIYGSYVQHSYDILINYSEASDSWTANITSDEGTKQSFNCQM